MSQNAMRFKVHKDRISKLNYLDMSHVYRHNLSVFFRRLLVLPVHYIDINSRPRIAENSPAGVVCLRNAVSDLFSLENTGRSLHMLVLQFRATDNPLYCKE